jgi:putative membrane protein
LPLVFALFAGGGNGDQTQLFFAVPVLLGTLFGAVKWWRFTYPFDGQHLVIDEGVLTRKRRVVPLDRVQQVELRSKLRHRLFGVTVLRVDTAGGGNDAEVDLSVVSVAEAARLRAILLPSPSSGALTATSGGERTDGRGGEVLVRLSPWRLAIAGMTGQELALMLTIVGWSFQFVDDLPIDLVEDLDGRLSAPSSVAGFAGAALTVLVAWFGLAAIAGIVKHFGFEMRRTGADLRVRRGMFERREGSMPVRRLQAVVVAQSIVRRALGFASVALQSGGQATGTSGGVSRIDVPLLDRGDVEPLLRRLLPLSEAWSLGAVAAHPPAARRRAIVRRVVLAAVAVVAPAVVLGGPEAVALVGLALVVAVVAGELAYDGLGHAAADGIVTARAGGLARSTVVVPGAKVQSTRLRSTPLQRRAGLATLSIDVAGKGRTPTIRDADLAELRVLQASLVLASDVRVDEDEVRSR